MNFVFSPFVRRRQHTTSQSEIHFRPPQHHPNTDPHSQLYSYLDNLFSLKDDSCCCLSILSRGGFGPFSLGGTFIVYPKNEIAKILAQYSIVFIVLPRFTLWKGRLKARPPVVMWQKRSAGVPESVPRLVPGLGPVPSSSRGSIRTGNKTSPSVRGPAQLTISLRKLVSRFCLAPGKSTKFSKVRKGLVFASSPRLKGARIANVMFQSI